MSTGTEGIAFTRSFDDGTHWAQYVRYPFVPGYAATGVVEDAGDGVDPALAGRVVFHGGPHASEHVLPASSCIAVPSDVEPGIAPWLALARIAFVGIRTAGVAAGDGVLIVGAGPIGQMCVRWASVEKASPVIVVDPVAWRLEIARRGGATTTVEAAAGEASAPVLEAHGELPDKVIDATGNADAFPHALGLAGFRGIVVILGDTGSPARQHLTSDVISKGLTIVGAHASHLPAVFGLPAINPFARSSREERAAVVQAHEEASARVADIFFAAVADGRFSLDGLTSHVFRPTECADAYRLAATSRAGTMRIVFDWTRDR